MITITVGLLFLAIALLRHTVFLKSENDWYALRYFLKIFMLGLLLNAVPSIHAQEPRYGGIVSNHPITTSEVLGIEETWLGLRSGVGTTSILVRYQVSCDNGNGQAGASKSGSFIASNTSTNNATFSFAGTGQFFPCNGWLNWASAVIYNPNTITPGELMIQLEIHNALPIGWNVAAPAANGATTTSVVQSILTGTIEEVLFSGSMVSGYVASWPSAGGYGTNPTMTDLGTVQNINVANPAAGANWTCGAGGNASCVVLSNQNQVQVINITYTLATSAAAGNRFACIYFRTGGVAGTVVGTFCSPYAQQPSTTVTYSFAAGVGWATNCTFLGGTQTAVKCPFVAVPLPAIWEANGQLDNFAITSFVSSEVSSTTSSLDVADTLTNINIRARVKHAND